MGSRLPEARGRPSGGLSPWAAPLLVLTTVGCLGCNLGSDSPEGSAISGTAPRLLVFTKTAGFRHASIEPALAVLQDRALLSGVEIDATASESAFTTDNLREYDAVVFLSTTGDVLGATGEHALEEFVRAGGGFAGIHSAADTEYGWAWYGELVGAYFESHPPDVRTATLHVADALHPSTSVLPNPWVRDDEWYDFRDVQPGLGVLLEIDETTYKTPAENPDATPRAIAWRRDFDGGRTFYTALGHTTESWEDEFFVDHVWGGVLWAMGS